MVKALKIIWIVVVALLALPVAILYRTAEQILYTVKIIHYYAKEISK